MKTYKEFCNELSEAKFTDSGRQKIDAWQKNVLSKYPHAVFHGSNNDFGRFRSKPGSIFDDLGFHFAKDINTTAFFAKGSGFKFILKRKSYIYAYNLDGLNIVHINTDITDWSANNLALRISRDPDIANIFSDKAKLLLGVIDKTGKQKMAGDISQSHVEKNLHRAFKIDGIDAIRYPIEWEGEVMHSKDRNG